MVFLETIGNSCLGNDFRLRGQNLVPDPPAMTTAQIKEISFLQQLSQKMFVRSGF